MKRLLFIYNPQAGRGIIKNHLAAVADLFTKAGYLVTVWPTQGKEDAAHVAAQQGWWYDRVVCCGGDGTLSETVSGLLTLDQPPVLGYIPAGTTNDFSKNLGLPRGVENAAATAAAGVPRPCDMGRFNERTFVYVAAFGIFTDVSYGTPQHFKSAFGHLAYVLEGDFLYGMVTNTSSVGGFKIFPPSQISLNDGVFEVVLIRQPRSLADFQETLLALARQSTGASGRVEAFHTSRLTITAQDPIPWTLDGEYGGAPETAKIENLHKALTLVWGK